MARVTHDQTIDTKASLAFGIMDSVGLAAAPVRGSSGIPTAISRYREARAWPADAMRRSAFRHACDSPSTITAPAALAIVPRPLASTVDGKVAIAAQFLPT